MIPHSKPTLGAEEAAAAARVLASGQLAQGPEVAAFEAEAAAFAGFRHGVALSSGTAALHLGLHLLGAGPERAVHMPAYACAALLQAAAYQRAPARLHDVGRDFNIGPVRGLDAGALLVLPHLFGKRAQRPAGAEAIVEDMAQSLGLSAGPCACAAASFYATKLITAGGEGGMLLTNDPAMAAAARDIRDYDNRDDFRLRFPYKITELQAAVGRVQLRRLPAFLARRRALAEAYGDGLAGLPLTLPGGEDHVFFRYVAAAPERDALQRFLASAGVEAKRPVHRPLHHYTGELGLPGAAHAHDHALSLPIYPGLTDEEQAHVIDSIRRFFDNPRGAAVP